MRTEDEIDADARPASADPPGQGTLLPRGPYEGVRMLTTEPQPVEVPR